MCICVCLPCLRSFVRLRNLRIVYARAYVQSLAKLMESSEGWVREESVKNRTEGVEGLVLNLDASSPHLVQVYKCESFCERPFMCVRPHARVNATGRQGKARRRMGKKIAWISFSLPRVRASSLSLSLSLSLSDGARICMLYGVVSRRIQCAMHSMLQRWSGSRAPNWRPVPSSYDGNPPAHVHCAARRACFATMVFVVCVNFSLSPVFLLLHFAFTHLAYVVSMSCTNA